MSKIGKKPIQIPAGVEIKITDREISAKGPKGEDSLVLHKEISVQQKENEIFVTVPDTNNRTHKELWGTFRSLIQNLVTGVSEGFSKRLEVNGVGYRVEVKGDKFVLNLGYSHPIELDIPKGLEIKVEKNVISVSGIKKQLVGEFAALIRSQRKPEPYKGKGIKYEDETIRRKAGKVVKAVGGG